MRLNRPALYFEGLGHGWSALLRRRLTDFRSPWRGIFLSNHQLGLAMGHAFAAAVTETAIDSIKASLPSQATLELLSRMEQYAPETGQMPITLESMRQINQAEEVLRDPRTVHAPSLKPQRKPMLPGRIQSNAPMQAVEGMTHASRLTQKEGISAMLRRIFSAFGSPWRGIISVEHDILERAVGPGVRGVVLSPRELDSLEAEAGPELAVRLQMLRQWSEETGFKPIAISRNVSSNQLRMVIRHERIHQQVGMYQRDLNLHPAHARRLQKQGGLVKSFAAGLRTYYPNLPKDVVKIAAERQMLKYADNLEAGMAHLGLDETSREMLLIYRLKDEALAYGNMNRRDFFRRMEAEGLRDPRKFPVPHLRQTQLQQRQMQLILDAFSRQAEQTPLQASFFRILLRIFNRGATENPMPPGRVQSNSPFQAFNGLARSGKLLKTSLVNRLRKALTSFGSPWRGIISVDPKLFEQFAGKQAMGGAASWSALQEMLPYASADDRARLETLIEWSRQTGLEGIVIKRTRHDNLRSVLRHERIHQQVRMYASETALSPQHQKLIRRFKNPVEAFARGIRSYYADSETLQEIRRSAPWEKSVKIQQLRKQIYDTAFSMAEDYRKAFTRQARQETSTRQAVEDLVSFNMANESVAYSQMHNRKFFLRMEAQGLKDPRKLPLRRLHEQAKLTEQLMRNMAAQSRSAAQSTRSQGLLSRLGAIIKGVL